MFLSRIHQIYIGLQILNAQCNQLFCHILTPYMKMFCSSVIVVGIFITIRLATKACITVHKAYLFMPFVGIFVSIKTFKNRTVSRRSFISVAWNQQINNEATNTFCWGRVLSEKFSTRLDRSTASSSKQNSILLQFFDW